MPPFKVIWREQIRRCCFEAPAQGEPSLDHVRDLIRQMLSIDDFRIQFRDCEDDLIQIGTDEELTIAVREARLRGKIPKFIVSASNDSASDLDPSATVSPAAINATQSESKKKWRANGPRGCRGSGRSKRKQNDSNN